MKTLLTMLLLVVVNAQAAVYKTINSSGEVVYSDTPTSGSERIKLPELPTYTPPPVKTTTRPPRTAVENVFYEDFTFLKPERDTTIRNNLGIVMIQTTLKPRLLTRLRHRIQFYLDGEPHGIPIDRTSVTLSNLDRGAHKLSASVVDQEGNILMSTLDTTVHVKRESVRHEKDAIDRDKLNIPRTETNITNPGFRTENPNIRTNSQTGRHRIRDIKDFSENPAEVDDKIADNPANPGFRNRNPNILSPNPNVRSQNPNIINPSPPPPKK